MGKKLIGMVICVIVSASALMANADTLPAFFNAKRIIGENNLGPVGDLSGTDLYDYARVIARVEKRSEEIGFCTASRVGENLFLTNFHCFEAVPCEDIQFTMGYERGVRAEDRQTFKCKRVLHKKLSLDFALYEAEPVNFVPYGSDEYPIMHLWDGEIEVGMPLVVASHPRGRLKEIDASPNCKLSSVVPQEYYYRRTITHTCDTEGGSSGSPILDRKTGFAIALHWGGNSEFNFCIPMHEIINELKRALPADILDDIFIER